MSFARNRLVGFEDFVVDLENRVVWFENEPVELPLKAVELLCVLVEKRGEVVSKNELLDRVWEDSFVEESILSQNVYRLRKAFKRYGAGSDLIQTIPRRGYRFAGRLKGQFEVPTERELAETNLTAPVATDIGSAPHSAKTDEQRIFVGGRGLWGLSLAVLPLLLLSAGFWFGPGLLADQNPGRNLEFERVTKSGQAYYPAISPDETHLAYVRAEKDRFSLVLRHLPTKSETVVIDPREYEIRSLEFCPDGHYLFYAIVRPDISESTVYRVPIYGGQPRKIVSNVRHHFSLAPDGQEIAFYRYDGKNDQTSLVVCGSDGTNCRIVSTRQHPYFYRVWGLAPAWSPDGEKFVATGFTQPNGANKNDPESYFLEIDKATGEERRLKHPKWKNVFRAQWLTSGDGLVVSAQEDLGKYSQLWHLSYPDGAAERITNDTNNYHGFRLNAESGSIITTNISQAFNLFLVSLENPDEVRQLTHQTVASNGLFGIDWSPDSKEIVYVRSEGFLDGNIWKLNLETGDNSQLTFDENMENRYPVVSPDGRIYFSSNREANRHIWSIDIDGGALEKVTNGESGENYPEISRDGKWIFYNTPGTGPLELWRRPLKGGKAEKVLHNSGGVSGVSPADPSMILAYHFDPAEKKRSPWKYVLFSHENASSGLKDMGFAAEAHAFDWSAEGSGIFYPNKSLNQNNIWFLSIHDGSKRQVTQFDDLRIMEVSASPDGKWLALSRGSSLSNIIKITGLR